MEKLYNAIMSDIFPTRVLNYNLRSQTDFFSNTVKTKNFGFDLLRYFASKVWSILLIEIKNSSTVKMFKNRISRWEPNDSECKLCQDYLHRIGYVNLVDDYPFVASVLILVIPDPRDSFTYDLEGCCKHVQIW